MKIIVFTFYLAFYLVVLVKTELTVKTVLPVTLLLHALTVDFLAYTGTYEIIKKKTIDFINRHPVVKFFVIIFLFLVIINIITTITYVLQNYF